MDDFYYGTRSLDSLTSATSGSEGMGVWAIISLVLAVVGGIVLYFTFLAKKNETKFTGFLGWMYDFLTFKKMVIENILKMLYLILALFITLSSFGMITVSFISFLAYLLLGNLIVRILYELCLVVLVICRNTTDINKKLDTKKIVDKEEE